MNEWMNGSLPFIAKFKSSNQQEFKQVNYVLGEVPTGEREFIITWFPFKFSLVPNTVCTKYFKANEELWKLKIFHHSKNI